MTEALFFRSMMNLGCYLEWYVCVGRGWVRIHTVAELGDENSKFPL